MEPRRRYNETSSWKACAWRRYCLAGWSFLFSPCDLLWGFLFSFSFFWLGDAKGCNCICKPAPLLNATSLSSRQPHVLVYQKMVWLSKSISMQFDQEIWWTCRCIATNLRILLSMCEWLLSSHARCTSCQPPKWRRSLHIFQPRPHWIGNYLCLHPLRGGTVSSIPRHELKTATMPILLLVLCNQ